MKISLLIVSVLSVVLTGRSFRGFLTSRFRHTRVEVQSTTVPTVTDDSSHLLRKNIELYDKYGRLSDETIPNPVGSTLQTVGQSSSSPYGAKPEVLSPAGGWPQLKAAVSNGADACYFGLQEGFNARARASNFAIDELSDVMKYLHERGCKGYLVVNILVFDEEMARLEPLIRRVAAAGVDALIMQDMGAVEFVRQIAPNLPVHGSTQMTITDANGALFTQRLGVERVVVGRELSIEEIASVSKSGVEIEAFVHGALCVSYSGQCYSSEAWGGRSANRGQCAQACRMPYQLILNGSLIELADDVKYLLSPQDLSAIDLVPELITAGVKSFKIEGRLKGPEYAAITTKAYRLAVDAAWEMLHSNVSTAPSTSASSISSTSTSPTSGKISNTKSSGGSTSTTTSVSSSSSGSSALDAQLLQDLKQVFSRGQDADHDGLSEGFLRGSQHQALVRGRSPRHRGLYMGAVAGFVRDKVHGQGVLVDLKGPVKRGDGLVFDRGEPEAAEEGGAVYEVADVKGRSLGKTEVRAGRVGMYFARGGVDWGRVRVGDLLWRNKDPALDARLKALTDKADTGVVEVYLRASGGEGQPLRVDLSTAPFGDSTEGSADADTDTDSQSDSESRPHHPSTPLSKPLIGTATTDSPLVPASSRPLGRQELIAALGTLGDTPFILDERRVCTAGVGAGLFVPVKEVKEVRRRAVAGLLEAMRGHDKDRGVGGRSVLLRVREEAVHSAHRGSYTSASPAPAPAPAPASAPAPAPPAPALPTPVELSVLCRTPAQATAACAVPWLTEVTLDFLEVHGLREAVRGVKESGKRAVVATPRIIKPNEERLYTFYLRLQADALLVRSAGFLQQLLDLGGAGAVLPQSGIRIPPLRGDFSLNAANLVSTGLLLGTGLTRLAPTHDLNAAQIVRLAHLLGPLGAPKLEVIIHQHLAVFHTEHCVFCRFLSDGSSFLDCGHPCETNTVALRDHQGQDHLVLADMGCRNTVFSAKAQTGAPYLTDFIHAGLRHFRVELVDETAPEVGPLLAHYHSLVEAVVGADAHGCGAEPDGLVEGRLRALWGHLEGLPNGHGAPQGVGVGSLEPRQEREWGGMKPTARR